MWGKVPCVEVTTVSFDLLYLKNQIQTFFLLLAATVFLVGVVVCLNEFAVPISNVMLNFIEISLDTVQTEFYNFLDTVKTAVKERKTEQEYRNAIQGLTICDGLSGTLLEIDFSPEFNNTRIFTLTWFKEEENRFEI